MLKYNNNHLFTGYLKQLLHDFNLPQYRVYTAQDALYKANHPAHEESPNIIASIPKQIVGTEKDTKTDKDIIKYLSDMYYVHYIKDNQIQDYVGTPVFETEAETGLKVFKGYTYEWKINPYYHYHFNKKELNQTRKLRITNNIYDSYTHEYFGNYLRFLRDYNHLDLMSMYNCFSNKLCDKISLTINNNGDKLSTSDKYKVYMLPVKLFNKYTIAIDCSAGAEICCGLYSQYAETNEALVNLPKYTYAKISSMRFNEPIVYDKLYNKCIDDPTATPTPIFDPNNVVTVGDVKKIFRNELAQHEESLKMFIRLPASCKSSIVILEGDYASYTPITYVNTPKKNNKEDLTQNLTAIQNRSVINFEYLDDIVDSEIKIVHPLQLLQMNTGTSYPFADRLMEFMLDNTITNMDYIVDDIDRVQKVISLYTNNNANFTSGAWSDNIKYYVYEYMTTKTTDERIKVPLNALLDSTGYIDKDVEKYYSAYDPEIKSKVSISNVDIYSNI